MSRKLLVLSQRIPYPLHSGAAIRTYGLLRGLAKKFELAILCFNRDDPDSVRVPVAERLAHLRQFGTAEAVDIAQQHNRIRYVWDHARSVLLRKPYTYYMYKSLYFERLVREAMEAGGICAVHVDSIDLIRCLPLLCSHPIFLTHHNVESQLLFRRASRAAWPSRAYLRLQGRLVERAEQCWARRVAMNVMVSEIDRVALESSAPGAKCHVVPNAVDVGSVSISPLSGGAIVFVGGTDYFPNLEALHWFGSEVVPHLRRSGSTSPIVCVGQSTVREQRSLKARYGLHLTGFVADLRPIFAMASCFIAPLQTGGGTRLKILDAWAAGLPVVSTSIGCEGLAAQDGRELLIRDDPLDFANAIRALLADPELSKHVGLAGRKLVEEAYNSEVIGRMFAEAYEAAIHLRLHEPQTT